jgi:hypothetical protein
MTRAKLIAREAIVFVVVMAITLAAFAAISFITSN